jgi:hypothetical protein
MPFPDSKVIRERANITHFETWNCIYGVSGQRVVSSLGPWGPFETIGDFIRADALSPYPATLFCGGSWWDTQSWKVTLNPFQEYGISQGADDDGDGILDERDERDMVFTWIANHFTTRANVFDVDVSAEICDPPFYPGKKLPFPVSRSRREHARKQLLAILDRSTTLRVSSDGRCDFTGPVEVRMIRMTDDLRVY